MKTKFKKISTVLLTVVMMLSVFSVMPITADAARDPYVHIDKSTGWKYKANTTYTECYIMDYIYRQEAETSLTIPSTIDGMKVIDMDMGLSGFTSLTKLYFEDDCHLTVMPYCAGCKHLSGIYVSIKGGGVCYDTLLDSITTIKDGTFSGTNINYLTLPNVTQIGHSNFGKGAFENCKKLINVTIKKPAVIYDNSFKNCYYGSEYGTFWAGTTVDYYGSGSAWNGNKFLYSPNFLVKCKNEKNEVIDTVGWCGGTLQQNSHNTLWWCMDKSGNVNINCARNMEVDYLQEQILDTNRWKESNIKSVTMNNVYAIGELAFCDCQSLESVNFSSTLTSIGKGAFQKCSSIERLTLPSGLKDIGECVFSDCSNLKSVTLPSSVTNIRKNAFGECTSLKDIFFEGTTDQWNNVTKEMLWKPETST